MLIQFSVENFRSFKDEVVLSLVAAPITERKENTIQGVKPNLLKSAAIYGANASGKSNLLMAMAFMKDFVLTSSKESQATESISYLPFRLSKKTENKPSIFEVIFVHSGIRYRYGFAIDDQKVYSEWLYLVKNVRELEVFTRDGQKFNLSSHFKSEEPLVKNDRIRPNALFLSVSAQLNGKIATQIMEWFSRFNTIFSDKPERIQSVSINIARTDSGRKAILNMLKNADMQIEDLQLTETEFNKMVVPPYSEVVFKIGSSKIARVDIRTSHNKYDETGKIIGREEFDLFRDESAGTQKFFTLSGLLIDTLEKGKVLVIDELDARLHPRMILEICEMFNSKERNPNNAQLIFVTHNTRLLDKNIFRRDQIFFLQKNRQEASELYSLVEFAVDGKKIRKDASYEKDYLLGRYGAVPLIREFEIGYGK